MRHLFKLLCLCLLAPTLAWASLGTSISLVEGPGAVLPSQTKTLQITLSNNNIAAQISGTAFNTTLPGTLPNGLKISGAASYQCTDPSNPGFTPTGSITATLGSQVIALTGGSIPARSLNTDGTCIIQIPVTAETSTGNSASYTYTIASAAVTGNDGAGVSNSGSVGQSIEIQAMTQPTIEKSFLSSSIVLGGAPTTLTITLDNSNSIAVEGFSITDAFPTLSGIAIIKVAATPAATANCNNGGAAPTFTPVAGAFSISATGVIPANNGQCILTVNVEGNTTNSNFSTGNQTNRIDKATDFSNDLGIEAASDATATISVASPLGVQKSFANSSLTSGENDSFTITLNNDSTSPLNITNFTDNPIDGLAGVTFGLVANTVSNTCGGTSVVINSGDGIQLTGGTIPANSFCTVTGNFTGTAQTTQVPITYTNSISAGAVDVGVPTIISQARSASLLVADDLRVLKTALPATAAPGNPVQYTVTIENYSSVAITSLTIDDALPTNFTYLTGTINGNDFSPSLSGSGCVGLTERSVLNDASADFTIATIPPRNSINSPSSCSVTFWAMINPTAADNLSTVNTLSAGSVCYSAGTICNGVSVSSSPNTTRVEETVFSAVKSFNGSTNTVSLPEGTVTTLSIELMNTSANPLTNVTVSDNFPSDGLGQLLVATPANASTTCGGAPTITTSSGTTSLAITGATVPARANAGTGANGTCVLNVDVIGPAGTYDNVAQLSATQTFANNNTALITPFDSSTARLIYQSSLTASKSFSPASVSSGGKSRVTVRMNNNGSVLLSSLSMTDPLPSGMVLASPVNASTSCGGTPLFSSAIAGASTITLQDVEIAGNSSCDVLFDVTATGASSWTNIIPVANIMAAGGVINVSPITATLNFNTATSISVSKSINPSTLTFPGETGQLTIAVNNGTTAVTNLSVTDYFTADGTSGAALNGMALASNPAATTTCPGGVLNAQPNGSSVGISGVSLANGASCTLTVTVTSSSVGGITNFIPIGAVSTDQSITNAGQAAASLSTQSNIGVVKQFTPNTMEPGQRSRLRITFYNSVAQPLSNIAVIDTLPAGVTIPSGANPTTTCTGVAVTSPANNQVQINGGSMPAASGSTPATCYAEIDVFVAAEGDYVNTIPAAAVTADSGGASISNSAPTSDTLQVKTPLVIHKAFDNRTLDTGNPVGFTTDSASRTPGASVTLTIHLQNPNAQNLTAAAFTDNLPAGLVVAQTPNASSTCSNAFISAPSSATSISVTGATIPASSSCTVTVDVLSNISGSYINSLPAAAVSTAEGVSNTEATSAELIVSTPPAVDKQFNLPVIAAGGTSTLTIEFENDNSSSATLSSAFVDTLPTAPGNIVISTTPNVVKTCPGTVTATSGAGMITYANGATIPAGGCRISVDVTGTVLGEHINNIPAGSLTTNLGNNQLAANSSLLISPLGYIAGRVFEDNDVTPNGSFDNGTDSPITGNSIALHAGANCSAPLVSITGVTNPVNTDSLGNYLFPSLPTGTYSACQATQPTGTNNAVTTAGSIIAVSGSTGVAGSASNPTTTSSEITGIVLNADGGGGEISGSSGNNFAEIVTSTLSGTVFLDDNNNGVQNGSDNGISGINIELLDSGNTVINSAVTDANGNYSFANIAPGTYSIRQPSQPANTASGLTVAGTVANGGTAGSVTAPTTVPSLISGIILPPKTTSSDNNFAEIPQSRRISGSVFLDYDNSGTTNGSDHGIANQTINLTGTDTNGNPISLTTSSASDGSYTFSGLPEGTYTLTQPNQPASTNNGITTAGSTGGTATAVGVTPSAISNINLSGTNSVSGDNNFAEVPNAAVDLAISKTHSPSSLSSGSTLGFYTITPSNIGTLDSSGIVTITDTLPAGITANSWPTSGVWICGVAGQVVTCNSSTPILAGSTGTNIILGVTVANGLDGQLLINNVTISGGSEPLDFTGNNSDDDSTPIAQSTSLQGNVWIDTNHDRIKDVGEQEVQGWIVELFLNGLLRSSTTTAADGSYSFTQLSPGSGYRVKFSEPTTGTILGLPVTNENGISHTNGVANSTNNPAGASNADGSLDGLTLLSGSTNTEQSLPLDPSGVVYDSITRQAIAGATVTLVNGGGAVPAACLVGANNPQVTGALGFYQFLLINPTPGGCPGNGVYTLQVTQPAGYLPPVSTIIPETAGAPYTPIANVNPTTDAIQTQATAPVGANPTIYYLGFTLTLGGVGVVNNHIPIDPILGGAIAVSKTTPKTNVVRGELVPYTITATNTLASALSNIALQDNIPAGFKYIEGSATIDGVKQEPVRTGSLLSWPGLTFAPSSTQTIQLVLIVGSGVGEGNYVNQAWAFNTIASARVSNTSSATVKVVPDPLFDCSDLVGKVFDDTNINGYQDEGESGLAGIRVATVRGLLVTTDKHGRFHVACADVPNELHGSNFIMKLDERTLPSGYRVTTENPRVVRLTRGKLVKLNFGAALHHIVRVDLDQNTFTIDGKDLTEASNQQLQTLLSLLEKQPSQLRLTYSQQNDETQNDTEQHLRLFSKRLTELWQACDCAHYVLSIETEILPGISSTKPAASGRVE